MKKKIIAKIVVWSTIAVLLTVVLIVFLCQGTVYNVANFIKSENGSFSIEIGPGSGISFGRHNAALNNVGNGNIGYDEACALNDINISWISGDVNIKVYDGEELKIEENGANLLTEDEKLRYGISNDTLYIDYAKKKEVLGFSFINDDIVADNKKLTIWIPEFLNNSLDALNIECETVDATVNIGDIYIEYLNVGTVSGNINIDGVVAENIDVESVSGECYVKGEYDDANIESVSGNLNVYLDCIADCVEAETISGNVDIYVYDACDGFVLEYETVSGDFNCGITGITKDGVCLLGAERTDISVETVSGDIAVNDSRIIHAGEK